jgi:signal transduction histidine kinase
MACPHILEVAVPGASSIPWTSRVRVQRVLGTLQARPLIETGGHELIVLHDSDQSELLLQGCTLPVVVVTGSRDVDRAVALLRAGAVDYVEPLLCEESCLRAVTPAAAKSAMNGPLDPKRIRAVQANLIERERLATVGKLAAGVAHSINNPAAYVVANLDEIRECMAPLADLTQLALDAIRRQGSEQERTELKRLVKIARAPMVFDDIGDMLAESLEGMGRIRDIVHDLKGFSAQDDEAPLPTDLTRVVETALHLAQADLKHRVNLQVHMPELPPVLGASGRLSQVVLQLLLNALQSFDDEHQGERRVEVIGVVDQGAVALTVRDNGRGMDRNTQERIWDPFFTTHTRGALGLGLPICQDIIARHGGTLTVESAPGAGTSVTVRMPSMQDAVHFSRLENPLDGATDPLHGASILVVDDEPAIVRCIQRLLRAAGEVRTATSGRDALDQLLEGLTPDLILCDLMMVDLSGVELYEQVLAQRPELEPRILFITGGAFTDRTRAFTEEHFDRIIEKPFESKVLRDRLRAALSTTRQIGPPVLRSGRPEAGS